MINKQLQHLSSEELASLVRAALAEDLGPQCLDVSAALIPEKTLATATIITREAAVICGQAFVEEVCRQVDAGIQIQWHCKEGGYVQANQLLCELSGQARALVTAERTCLNFLQTLSGTATLTRRFVDQISHTPCRLLDTRKTLPGLRLAQKYAVICGGATNHRMGLFDAYLIKENHIEVCGGITAAVQTARRLNLAEFLEVEVETMDQLREALEVSVSRIMLDNFSLEDIQTAVKMTQGKTPLEASGNVSLESIGRLAETGVDFISVGGLTKHVRAIDLSMRVHVLMELL